MKEIIKVSATLAAICAAVTLAVAGANLLTADKIAQSEQKAITDSLSEVLPCDSYDSVSDNCYKAADKGYIFITAANGYGGEVSVMTAIAPDGKIIAVKVLSCSDETPGLGQNSQKAAFTDQYKGQSGTLEVVKSGAADGQINAITSATITSRAVTAAVNEALAQFDSIAKEAVK